VRRGSLNYTKQTCAHGRIRQGSKIVRAHIKSFRTDEFTAT